MTDDGARARGMSLGAVDFVTKPIDPASIKLRVDNFMRYVRMRRELQADYDSMLEAARLREDMEDIIRHDMRGPLSTVLSVVQGFMADKNMARRHALQLEAAEQATLKLLDMINLSSELYKIETGRYVLDAKPVPLADIVRRVAELARATFVSKHLTVAVDSDVDVGKKAPQAFGDAMLTYSLVHSLVKNTCEVVAERSRITIKLIDANPLQVIITHKGALPLQVRSRFFEKFVTWGKARGNSLGAYAARLMAEAQRGSVHLDVDDDADVTTLTVALPREPDNASAA